MIAVAQLIQKHRTAVARTLRETFGVGLSDLGDGLTWGEAKILLHAAAADGGTALGAELADWAYPATTRDLISLMAQIGNEKVARKLMPWALPRANGTPTATADEIAQATAELEDGIVFT